MPESEEIIEQNIEQPVYEPPPPDEMYVNENLHWQFDTLEDANAAIAQVNAVLGYPNASGTQTWAEALLINDKYLVKCHDCVTFETVQVVNVEGEHDGGE